MINGGEIGDTQTYRVAINNFLMSGREAGLDFLTLQQPGVKLVSEKRDIRLVVIDPLKANKTSEKVLTPVP